MIYDYVYLNNFIKDFCYFDTGQSRTLVQNEVPVNDILVLMLENDQILQRLKCYNQST